MLKTAAIAGLGSLIVLVANPAAQGQVVTSYYAPYTAYSLPAAPAVAPVAAVAPAVVPAAVAPSTLVGSIPVRTGLFGWRTTQVPVYGPSVVAPVAAVTAPTYSAAMPAYSAAMPAYTAAMPAYSAAMPAYSAAVPSYAAARPVITPAPVSSGVAVPSAVYQSGYRGYTSYYGATAAPLTVPSIGVAPTVIPVNTFYPTAVMSMQ